MLFVYYMWCTRSGLIVFQIIINANFFSSWFWCIKVSTYGPVWAEYWCLWIKCTVIHNMFIYFWQCKYSVCNLIMMKLVLHNWMTPFFFYQRDNCKLKWKKIDIAYWKIIFENRIFQDVNHIPRQCSCASSYSSLNMVT